MRISCCSSDVCSSDLSSYVALSRHRHGTALHYGRDDFADEQKLRQTLARERLKDMALDYRPNATARGSAGSVADQAQAPNSNRANVPVHARSEEHTSELQSLMRNSYAVFCLKKKKTHI